MEDKERYQVKIPDLDYYKEQIRCRQACPVKTDVKGYLESIYKGNLEEARNIAKKQNPLALICSYICAHPCESECRRGKIDSPVSIRALKRHAFERGEVSALDPNSPFPAPSLNKKVAIIGSGPAGLSAAYELSLLGYKVTIFESSSKIGGMLYYGIPKYRLKEEIIERDIKKIKDLGVEIRCNVAVGKDIHMNKLKEEGFSAVLIAIGAQLGRPLNIEGTDLKGVYQAVDFLRKVNQGIKVELGKKVVVIGGGNVAIDAARSAIRLGADEVYLTCLEKREEMPADDIEIHEALEEGVIFYNSRGPTKILGDKGRVTGLETLNCESLFDSEGRFNPKLTEGSEFVLDADTIIISIGQMPDAGFYEENVHIRITRFATIIVDDKMSTSIPGVFACGDVVTGPRVAIDAIASGKKAASFIHSYFSEKEIKIKEEVNWKKVDLRDLRDNYEGLKRVDIPTLSPDERIKNIDLVEIGYSKEEAQTEAKRCLKCSVNTIFNSDLCILCGGCVDVCPHYCLKLVKLEEIEGNGMVNLIKRNNKFKSAIIKDEERCIRCGLCVKRCPMGAISMMELEVKEEVIYE
jgi:NADPH-dependent glutamate synthase beta subunit-like oxidoreductase